MKLTLKAARINAGFTQEEASERLHIHKSSLSNYETGKTAPPMDIALLMAELYDVPINDLNFCKAISL
jgi:DNA-binding XRE family transcriptional regulator